jgi:hypothetical protein
LAFPNWKGARRRKWSGGGDASARGGSRRAWRGAGATE